MITDSKNFVRRKLLNARLATPNAANKEASEKIFKIFKKHFHLFDNFQRFALYFPIKNEVDTAELIDFLQDNNKITLIPSITKINDILEFKTYNGEKVTGKFAIQEATGTSLIPEVIIIPCVGYSSSGFRLGFGGGYYDRTLNYYQNTGTSVVSIGLAYKNSIIMDENIFREHDAKMRFLIHEENIIQF